MKSITKSETPILIWDIFVRTLYSSRLTSLIKDNILFKITITQTKKELLQSLMLEPNASQVTLYQLIKSTIPFCSMTKVDNQPILFKVLIQPTHSFIKLTALDLRKLTLLIKPILQVISTSKCYYNI